MASAKVDERGPVECGGALAVSCGCRSYNINSIAIFKWRKSESNKRRGQSTLWENWCGPK